MIAAAFASEAPPQHPRGVERLFVDFEGRRIGLRALEREKRRAECAHQTRDIGPHNMAADLLLECAQHRVVEECAALHDDVFSELARIVNAQHLVEGVADNGAAEPRGNVFDRSAVALRLTHLRIHEDRAARAKVARALRAKRGLHEFGKRLPKLLSEGLKERAAPRGTGFVQLHAGNEALLDLKTLHVLAADVDHVARPWIKGDGGALMRQRFDFRELPAQRGLGEIRTVARRAERAQEGALRNLLQEALHLRVKPLERIAFIQFVPAVGKPPLLIDERPLHRRGSEVDAEEERAGRVFKRHALGLFGGMAGLEFAALLCRGKKRGEARIGFGRNFRLLERFDEGLKRREGRVSARRFFPLVQSGLGGAPSHGEVPVLKLREFAAVPRELALEGLAKFREE